MNYNNEFLIAEAQKAREYAYAPYSNFLVGAVLVTTDGKLYHGCNIENASYPATNCAERTAFFKAISDGEINFSKIAIVGAPKGEEVNLFTTPCGICRQVMMEFCDPETFIIIMPDGNGGIVEILLKDLMPFAFGPNNIC